MNNQQDILDFTDRCIVITGAGSGMGKEAQQAFSQRGAAVVLCDINETAIQELEHEIKADGGKALAVKTDVQIFEEVQHEQRGYGTGCKNLCRSLQIGSQRKCDLDQNCFHC